MGENYKITQEVMEKAQTYIPIAMKELIASDLARDCIKETRMIRPHDAEDSVEPEYGLRPVYGESPSTKARIMMTILLSMYLKVWDDDAPFLCPVEEYDNWAGAHVLNQIERFKSGEYREKAFDLIADYREMERYLNSAIYSVLRELNDPVKRFMEAMGEIGSAEGIQKALDTIESAYQGIEQERQRQDEIIKESVSEDGE